MTCDKMLGSYFFKLRSYLLTDICCVLTSCVELTALRRVNGAWDIPFQYYRSLRRVGVCRRYGLKQRDSIRVNRMLIQSGGGCKLDDVAEIHYAYPVGYVFYDRQVMGYEQVC